MPDLYKDNEALVWHIAKRYMRLGVEPAELIQEGRIALWEASISYKGGRGANFCTYACSCIKYRILRVINKSRRKSRDRRRQTRLTNKIASRLECPRQSWDCFDRIDCRSVIDSLTGSLTYREKEVLHLRFGLSDGYQYNLGEVGRIFQITRERVRQIEIRAIFKMRHPVRCERLRPFVEPPWSNTIPQKQTSPVKSSFNTGNQVFGFQYRS